jgi:hypothetical protein
MPSDDADTISVIVGGCQMGKWRTERDHAHVGARLAREAVTPIRLTLGVVNFAGKPRSDN